MIFFGTHGQVVSETAQQTFSPSGVSNAYTNHSVLDTDVILRRIRYGPTARAGVLAQGRMRTVGAQNEAGKNLR